MSEDQNLNQDPHDNQEETPEVVQNLDETQDQQQEVKEQETKEDVNENIHWYVLRAISGQEKKVKSYLETEVTRAKLNAWIPEILIPMEKVYEVRNGKKRVREKNFFPGYMMIKADLTYGEVFHTITTIPGVIGFLEGTQSDKEQDSKGKKKYIKLPMPMRQSEVNRILGRVDEEADVVEKIDATFVVGERVKVIGELFNGFDGAIEEIFEERKKLKVMVKVFGRDTPVELGYAQVEKID